MGESQEQVVKCLRGLCVSSKGLLSLRQLRSDYYAIIGENIPHSSFGYKRLEDFIKSIDSLDLINKNGEPFVQARVTEQSAHISAMVSRQKATTSKKRGLLRVRFANNRAPRFNNSAALSSKWRPKTSFDSSKKYHGSQRPQSVAHAQFVQKSVPSKVVPSSNFQPVNPSMSQRSAQNHINNKPAVSNLTTRSTVSNSDNVTIPKKDMNTRLNHHREKKTTVDNTNNKENVITNGTTHPANLLMSAQNHQYPKNYAHDDRTESNQYLASHQGIKRSHSIPAVPAPAPAPAPAPVPTLPCTSDELASTKKRLNRMMSELSMDRDSGNCSPVSDISPPSPCKTPEAFPRTGDPLADLKAFAELHKLGEMEISTNTVGKKRMVMLTCKIKIGKHTYNSYPNEFRFEKEAVNFCCEAALADLVPKYQKRKSLLISSEQDILERIPEMLKKHNNGVWSGQLALDYVDKYKEQLPPDWLKIVDSSPCVQIEKLSDDHVLCPCNPDDKGIQRRGMGAPISNVSVPANTIELDKDSRFVAEITCANAANEIWLRQMQTKHSDEFYEMIGRMEVYYLSREQQFVPSNIVQNGCYVAKYENSYYRVRALGVGDTEVNCFFIDYGDEMSIPKDAMFELKREYASVQAQAVVVRLAGLEELYEMSRNSEALQEIFGQLVNLEAADETTAVEGDMSLPVYMYDLETGRSINEQLIAKLTMESASPLLSLQQENIIDVHISNIEENGDVYIQCRTYGFEQFISLTDSLVKEIQAKPPTHFLQKVTKANSAGKLYLACVSTGDGKWRRIQLIDWSPDGVHAQVYYVDVGNTSVIKVDQEILYPLESISDILNQYPAQATKVRMAGLNPIPKNFVEKATKAMPLDEQVLEKLIDLQPANGIPLVEFFRRNADGGLFSINRSLAMELEMQNEVDSKSRTKLSGSLSNPSLVPSSGTLPAPTIPDTGEFFPVNIPFAVNPYNFFVQPLESERELEKLMDQLQTRYQDVRYSSLKVEDVVPGNIYASRHEDNIWYRTSVIKVIHSGSVSVFFCDFGYYQNLTVQQLVPLEEEFLRLPYQALKAKLADIKPKHNKWSMDDCDQFKSMVEKKNFYSRIKGIEKDILYESDHILKLELIDTSTDDDVFVAKELIKNDIAVSA